MGSMAEAVGDELFVSDANEVMEFVMFMLVSSNCYQSLLVTVAMALESRQGQRHRADTIYLPVQGFRKYWAMDSCDSYR
jgi:hypothetical protein